MNNTVSANTKAILLLTAPLIVGRSAHSTELLSPGEYNRLARMLHDIQHEPADLLGPEASRLLESLRNLFDVGRLTRLLERGFLLSQAIERWHARAIWIVSRADPEYSRRLKERLKDGAPALLYGCGQDQILDNGGLAIVGSRNVDSILTEYALSVGQFAAKAGLTVVSGGARGIDRAAMQGALQGGGRAIGVLADSLERFALAHDLRESLLGDSLVLVSPYDPSAGFDVGHAMVRNKIIYALADAALVVSSDYEKGGTWAGAIEQLEKLHLVPVYVRSSGESSKGLEALEKRGALVWPNPRDPDALDELIKAAREPMKPQVVQQELPLPAAAEPLIVRESAQGLSIGETKTSQEAPRTPIALADRLFEKVKELALEMKMPLTADEVAPALQISYNQARVWLRRLAKEHVLEEKRKPLRYVLSSRKQNNLFEASDLADSREGKVNPTSGAPHLS